MLGVDGVGLFWGTPPDKVNQGKIEVKSREIEINQGKSR